MTQSMVEAPKVEASQQQAAAEDKPQAFTQDDVDRIVGERVKRERDKFADYAELKARAEGAKTVEQQLAELKSENARMVRDTLASRIAGRHGISLEDADLFLTGQDEETLTAQAKRLVARDEAAKSASVGPRVPKSGTITSQVSDDGAKRAFVRGLTGRDT